MEKAFLFLLSLAAVQAFTCPGTVYRGCQCDRNAANLICSGDKITEDILRTFLNDVLNLNQNDEPPVTVEVEGFSLHDSLLTSFDFTWLNGFNIKTVDLSNNTVLFSITGRSSDVKGETVLADNCVISSVDFPSSTGWKSVSLRNNQLRTVPSISAVLSNLENLDLSQNSITSISSNTLSAAFSLINLDLSQNFITSISANTFSAVYSLINLDLSGNEINFIDEDAFEIGNFDPNYPADQIFTLNLDDNQLSDGGIQKGGGLPRLSRRTSLSIKNNNFVLLHEDNFKNFLFAHSDNEILADGNEFVCDEHLQWLENLEPVVQNRVKNVNCVNWNSGDVFQYFRNNGCGGSLALSISVFILSMIACMWR